MLEPATYVVTSDVMPNICPARRQLPRQWHAIEPGAARAARCIRNSLSGTYQDNEQTVPK